MTSRGVSSDPSVATTEKQGADRGSIILIRLGRIKFKIYDIVPS